MEIELTAEERTVLAAIPAGGEEQRLIRVPGLTPRRRNQILARLEERGLVEIYPNGNGPEQPFWWQRLPKPPEGWTPPVSIEKGLIYDRYEPNGRPRVFIETTGVVNEFGCVRVHLKAGDNNGRMTWIPGHLLENFRWWNPRRRGEVTDYSSRFLCPVHGTVSENMVKTDKTCALCGSLLDRVV